MPGSSCAVQRSACERETGSDERTSVHARLRGRSAARPWRRERGRTLRAVRSDLKPGRWMRGGAPALYPPTSCVSMPKKCPRPATSVRTCARVHRARVLGCRARLDTSVVSRTVRHEERADVGVEHVIHALAGLQQPALLQALEDGAVRQRLHVLRQHARRPPAPRPPTSHSQISSQPARKLSQASVHHQALGDATQARPSAQARAAALPRRHSLARRRPA